MCITFYRRLLGACVCIYIDEGEVKKGMYRMLFISSPLSEPRCVWQWRKIVASTSVLGCVVSGCEVFIGEKIQRDRLLAFHLDNFKRKKMHDLKLF